MPRQEGLGESKQTGQWWAVPESRGDVQGDRSVNHQWLRFILPPLSKNLQGRLCVHTLQPGAWTNRKPAPTPLSLPFPHPPHPFAFLFAPICPPHSPPATPLACSLIPPQCTLPLSGKADKEYGWRCWLRPLLIKDDAHQRPSSPGHNRTRSRGIYTFIHNSCSVLWTPHSRELTEFTKLIDS